MVHEQVLKAHFNTDSCVEVPSTTCGNITQKAAANTSLSSAIQSCVFLYKSIEEEKSVGWGGGAVRFGEACISAPPPFKH